MDHSFAVRTRLASVLCPKQQEKPKPRNRKKKESSIVEVLDPLGDIYTCRKEDPEAMMPDLMGVTYEGTPLISSHFQSRILALDSSDLERTAVDSII